MSSLLSSTPIVNPLFSLFSDEWNSARVGEFAVTALRSPGGIAHMCNGLRVSSYHPWAGKERKVNSRIWVIESEQGEVLSEENSFFKAVRTLTR